MFLRLLRYIVGVCMHACVSYCSMDLCNCDGIVGFYLSRCTHYIEFFNDIVVLFFACDLLAPVTVSESRFFKYIRLNESFNCF